MEAFNRGTYKVIIGSTACIGEGLNLQGNSSALHHFDIPYCPSDFIQRNGRIDRQGNAQNSVELHTYLSAGTIDNYSVSLVQRKANWIDQLLKTKSSVFLNPNDESYIDADELLLALTEEWGDASKAEERRRELDRMKADKLAEARGKQRRDNLASLSLLRGALLSYNGDKGQMSYQNRQRKVAMLEKSLANNPAFMEHELVTTSTPFLYAKNADIIVRKSDMLIRRGKPYEVTSLDFRRREFTAHPSWEKRDSNEGNIVTPIHELKDDDTSTYFSQSGMEERRFLTSIHTKEFYGHSDRELQERHYHTHMRCSIHNDSRPPCFTAGDDGTLAVGEARYWNYAYGDTGKTHNPFSVSGMEAIRALAGNGIEADHAYRLEEYSALFRECLPELAYLLHEAIPQDEELYAEI